MLTNFEDYTVNITKKEIELVPFVMKVVRMRTKENPIPAKDFVEVVQSYINQNESIKPKIKFSSRRLRKCVNYIRIGGLAPLIATPKGYYLSTDETEVTKEIQCLNEMARSLNRAADGLSVFAK